MYITMSLCEFRLSATCIVVDGKSSFSHCIATSECSRQQETMLTADIDDSDLSYIVLPFLEQVHKVMYIYIYVYMYVCTYTYIGIYYIYRLWYLHNVMLAC